MSSLSQMMSLRVLPTLVVYALTYSSDTIDLCIPFNLQVRGVLSLNWVEDKFASRFKMVQSVTFNRERLRILRRSIIVAALDRCEVSFFKARIEIAFKLRAKESGCQAMERDFKEKSFAFAKLLPGLNRISCPPMSPERFV